MSKLMHGLGAAVVALAIGCCAASAQIAVSGTFTASQACAATTSIRKATNPGNVNLVTGMSYHVVAKNKPAETHLQVLVDGAAPERRWVSVDCGQLDAATVPTGPARGTTSAAATATGARATHLLAMSWQMQFCSGHRDKTECKGLSSASYTATHLSLHGLWPQPQGKSYCNVEPDVRNLDRAHAWDSLPEPDLSASTRQRLAAVMPGVQSNLQRHEWIEHGTCFGSTADAYFARAAEFAEAVNGSKVAKLFADNVGKTLSAEAIRAAFDDSFGAGAGERVLVNCPRAAKGARQIGEVRINLAGDVTGTAPLGDLMRAAQPAPGGCPGGLVQQLGR